MRLFGAKCKTLKNLKSSLTFEYFGNIKIKIHSLATMPTSDENKGKAKKRPEIELLLHIQKGIAMRRWKKFTSPIPIYQRI